MNIGFIGLGVMGAPMASHLLAAGHRVRTSVNRSAPPEDLTAAGLIVDRSPADVARSSDIVILMLPATDDVERVCFGDGGLAEGVMPGAIVVDMSSIDPKSTSQFAKRFADVGVGYLDAPVSGGQVGAKAASLTIMVGGPTSAFEKCVPLFEKIGKNITHVGEANGSGQTCKIANQIVVALTIEAVGEALVLARQAGCDPAKVRQALMGGFAASRVLDVHGERMITRKFEPGFRIALHAKDLDLALKAAADVGVAIPATALCRQLINSAKAAGDWNQDHSALVRSLERMAGASDA